jgi:hypothetical protein
MNKILKNFPSKTRKQRLHPETDAVRFADAFKDQSTSNLTLPASAVDFCPVGCETLFEGAAPIVAE